MPFPRRYLLSAVLPVALLAGLASAQKAKPVTPTIRVAVTVVDAKGVPIPDASVVLAQQTVLAGRMPKEPFHVELKTDEKGVAQIQGFVPGNVLVQVIAKGFQTYGQAFSMTRVDEAVRVRLDPPKPQVTIYH